MNRYLWVVEVFMRDGSWWPTEYAHMLRADARMAAVRLAGREKAKTRVVKYGPLSKSTQYAEQKGVE